MAMPGEIGSFILFRLLHHKNQNYFKSPVNLVRISVIKGEHTFGMKSFRILYLTARNPLELLSQSKTHLLYDLSKLKINNTKL